MKVKKVSKTLNRDTFSSWAFVILNNRVKLESATEWTSFRQPLEQLVKFWGLHLSSTVIDLGLPLEHWYTYWVPPLVLILVVVALWRLLLISPQQLRLRLENHFQPLPLKNCHGGEGSTFPTG